MQLREHPGYLSACCEFSVHSEHGAPDFPGDPSSAVTCWFVCDRCSGPCDLVARPGPGPSKSGPPEHAPSLSPKGS